MADQEHRPDIWARLESFAKILAGFSAAVSAILIPVFINSYTEQNRRTEMFVRTMTEREKSDTDIRQSMFNTLLTGYLGSLKEDFVNAFRRRITFLELLTINFQEFFNAKPLFEEVYSGLQRKRLGPQSVQERKKWLDLERQIIRVSMNIVSRQAKLLNNIGTSAVFNIEQDEKICVRLYRREELDTLRMQGGSRLKSYMPGSCLEGGSEKSPADSSRTSGSEESPRQSLEITLISVKRAYATVQVAIYDDYFNGNVFQGSRLKGSSEVDISYFDLPYMDNTKLSDGSRFALVRRYTGSDSSDELGEIEENSVEIEAIRFRNDFVSLRDRPFFEEMLQKLKTEGK
jgi:hypothetical protein